MQILDGTENKITEIDFDSYSIDLKNFDRVENGFLYADEKTTVELFGKVLSKKNNNEEFGILHTGHSLLICNFDLTSKGFRVKKTIKKTVSSKVYFSELLDEEIKNYVDSLEPLNCAGGFALEGRGGKYIEKIEGCYSNVMGLSLPWLRKCLLKYGIFA